MENVERNEIKIFQNEEFGEVRVTMDENGNPLFCLPDVCKVLELGNASQVKTRLSDGVISNEVISDSIGRQRVMNFVNEDGLYDVILDSRKPEARRFRKWITSEIIPSIRKHGAYMTENFIERTLEDPDYLIQVATKLKEEKRKRLEAEAKIEQDKPKVLFAEAVETSKRSCLVAELAKILKQNGIEIGQNRMFKWLRSNGYLCSKGEYYNQPTQKAMEMKLFELKKNTVVLKDGSTRAVTTTKVTGAGQIYFVNKFLSMDKKDIERI